MPPAIEARGPSSRSWRRRGQALWACAASKGLNVPLIGHLHRQSRPKWDQVPAVQPARSQEYHRKSPAGARRGRSRWATMTAVATGADRAGEGARVLVVDDEPNITDLLSTALRYTGFAVAVADSGRQALAQAASFLPELILLDVMLPDFDGFEVCRRLRDDGVNVPVLFLTARDATEDKVSGLSLGGDDYVTKPFSLEEVVARVRAVLRRSRPDASDSVSLQFADIEVNEDTHQVRRAGTVIALSV